MAGGGLDVPERDTGVKSRHDERFSEHVRVDGAKGGSFADGAHLAVGGAAVQALAVPALKDRAFVAVADGKVNGSGGPRDQRDRGGLVAFAEDLQRAVPAFETEVFDVGCRRLH